MAIEAFGFGPYDSFLKWVLKNPMQVSNWQGIALIWSFYLLSAGITDKFPENFHGWSLVSSLCILHPLFLNKFVFLLVWFEFESRIAGAEGSCHNLTTKPFSSMCLPPSIQLNKGNILNVSCRARLEGGAPRRIYYIIYHIWVERSPNSSDRHF